MTPRPTCLNAGAAALGLVSLALWSCTASVSDNTGLGGGGATGTGGLSAVSGSGSSGTGGAASGGRSAGSGGGASVGDTGRGGTTGDSGGSGNSVSGGSGSSGGGGSGSSGSGGSSAGGGPSAGGGAGSAGPNSPGCGSATPLKSGNLTEVIDGTTRNYTLDVPTGYDGTKPYRLIFVWHMLGGSASLVVLEGYDGLKSLANNSTIFVAPEGQYGSNSEAFGNGWWNVNNIDMKFLRAMLDRINANLCVDQTRIFSTGFSFGGMMTYTVGYEFNVFRALAPCSGDLQVIPHQETYTAPLPIMAFHGDSDTFVTTARGRAARDKYLARNKCGTQTQAVAPSPCVQYQGCAVPTFWCEFPGIHQTWSEEPAAIWKFFSQF